MRAMFCETLARTSQPDLIFLSGDLGFRALEPLRDAWGSRFINAGVAEQNMVSVAAGLARNSLRPWVYSIAPFVTARPFEQIRNDVCLHGLPVVLVGNGGGYGYGVMGATHHALEDYGILLTLPGLNVAAPVFDADLPSVIERLCRCSAPTYLRLGISEEPAGWSPPPYEAWRRLVNGGGPTILAVGTLAGSLWQACLDQPLETRPNLWCACELPLREIPVAFLEDVRRSDAVCVAEEHVVQGSVGAMLALALIERGCVPGTFIHRPALGYPSGRYGSQKFHRRECGLDPASVLTAALEGATSHA